MKLHVVYDTDNPSQIEVSARGVGTASTADHYLVRASSETGDTKKRSATYRFDLLSRAFRVQIQEKS